MKEKNLQVLGDSEDNCVKIKAVNEYVTAVVMGAVFRPENIRRTMVPLCGSSIPQTREASL